jgi:hypothetical protein
MDWFFFSSRQETLFISELLLLGDAYFAAAEKAYHR